MYIYKLTDSSGTFIGSSKQYPDYADPRYAKQIAKMINPTLTILRDDVDKKLINIEVFNEAINEILTSDTYNLLNGRFQSIDPIMEYMGRHFILVVTCEETGRVYIKTSYNPVEKLYRIFVCNRGRSELIRDLRTYGKECFKVDIITTFDNPYKQMLKLFRYYRDCDYEAYNIGTFRSLESAEKLVEGMNDASDS